MSTIPPNSSTIQPASRLSGGTFWSLRVIAIVAFVAATLFAAWIPQGYLPEAAAEQTYEVPNMTQQAQIVQPTVEPRIGIVAGHWSTDPAYYDPGAVCDDSKGGVKEVDINLAIATRTQKLLTDQGYAVDLLTEFDKKLEKYLGIAIVSIHTDSCEYKDANAKGFKVAAPLANPNPANSKRLVACIENRYAARTGMALHPGSITNDMTQYHAFYEINPDTPAAIIEVGFMNLDFTQLTEQQDILAQGVADGILCFLRSEQVNPTAVPTP